MKAFDLAIVGAGVAGMAAAIEAAGTGLQVVVLDDQPAPGGQVHRSVERRTLATADDRDGAAFVGAFRSSQASYLPDAALWQVERSADGETFHLSYSQHGRAQSCSASRLLLATGAMERPVPIPGWTLPGVMTVGAAQILLKTGSNVPAGRVVIAGQGPLPLLYATQLLKASVKPEALIETTPAGALRRALPHLFGALANADQLITGLRFLADIRAAGVPIIRHVESIEAIGQDRLSAVRFIARGKPQEIAADLLLLHEGVVPHTHLAMSLDIEHIWSDAQLCWHPRLETDGQTSIKGIRMAGDGTGIAGWRVAEIDGRLAGMAMAEELGKPPRNSERRESLRRQRAKLMRLRPFLDAWYRPRQALLAPDDEVMVCRCEEKTAADLRAAIRQGCLGPSQVKSATRCGMGPCQGRQCGLTLTTLIAADRGLSPEAVGAPRIRPPLKPLTLGELASLTEES